MKTYIYLDSMQNLEMTIHGLQKNFTVQSEYINKHSQYCKAFGSRTPFLLKDKYLIYFSRRDWFHLHYMISSSQQPSAKQNL